MEHMSMIVKCSVIFHNMMDEHHSSLREVDRVGDQKNDESLRVGPEVKIYFSRELQSVKERATHAVTIAAPIALKITNIMQ